MACVFVGPVSSPKQTSVNFSAKVRIGSIVLKNSVPRETHQELTTECLSHANSGAADLWKFKLTRLRRATFSAPLPTKEFFNRIGRELPLGCCRNLSGHSESVGRMFAFGSQIDRAREERYGYLQPEVHVECELCWRQQTLSFILPISESTRLLALRDSVPPLDHIR